MKKRLSHFIILALYGCLLAHADNGKVSLWLQQTVAEQAQQSRRAATEEQDLLTTVFLKTSQSMSDELLADYGAKRYAQLGDIAIVTLPLSQVEPLAAEQSVVRIEANQLAQPTMDHVAQAVNLLPVYQASSQHQAFTGRGVVVGVMDIGFDLTHPNFYSNSKPGEYRIKVFWDQLHPDADTSRFPVGRDFVTEGDILAQGCATDGKEQTHGTLTSGIAAGSGYDSPYRGVAYESDVCYVANAVSSDTVFIEPQNLALYTSATDALGFKYLFDYADAQGKPCVVSFSEGYTPYMDGDDLLYSQFLSRLTGPGRILVVAAGNENQATTYVDKPRGMEQAGAFVQCSKSSARYRLQTDESVTLTLHAYPNGQSLTKTFNLPADQQEEGKPLVDTLFVGTDTCAVSISSYPAAFLPGSTICQIALTANRPLSELPPLALACTGSGSHAELLGSSSYAFATNEADPRWNSASHGHNILAPACFDAAITVGSTSHRLSVTNINGRQIENKNDTEGLLSWYSSTGPTLDGHIKPDVTAPGCYVISSTSSYLREQYPDNTYYDVAHFDVNGRTYIWGTELGTSLAAPVVAGTIALWLEAKPDLTKEEIMGVLQRTCRHPDPALSYPNNLYGHGEIDAHRGLLDILGFDAISELSMHQPQQCRLWAEDGWLHLCFDQQPAEPVTISIYSAAGSLLHRQQVVVTSPEHSIRLPLMASGIYAVQLSSKDKDITGSQLIRI